MHVKALYLKIEPNSKKIIMNVKKAPPRKPSSVLFGLNLIRGVRPKDLPQKYAQASLVAIVIGMKTTQKTPS